MPGRTTGHGQVPQLADRLPRVKNEHVAVRDLAGEIEWAKASLISPEDYAGTVAQAGRGRRGHAAQRAVDGAVDQPDGDADVGADAERPGALVAARVREHAGELTAQHPVAQHVAAGDDRSDRVGAERGSVAVDRDEAELGLGQLGDVGELHAEQLARRGERALDRRVGALARDARECVERAHGRLRDGVEDAVHRTGIGIARGQV